MEKTACIIDTNQFIDCPEVLDHAVSKGYTVYIPEAVFKEINKTLSENADSIEFIEKILKAKKMIKKHEGKYMKAKSLINKNIFADPKILQYILELMSDRDIGRIIVYTADNALSRDIVNRISKIESIKHKCSVEAINYNKKCKTVIKSPEFLLFNDKYSFPTLTKDNSTSVEDSPIPTLSGNKKVLEFWINMIAAGDTLWLYKDIEINKGDKISINFMNLDNNCDVVITLSLWSEKQQHETESRWQTGYYQAVKEGKWNTISIVADNNYHRAIFNLHVNKDSVFNERFNYQGTFGYIDDFKITHD